MKSILVLFLAATVHLAAGAETDRPTPALKGHDPVALTDGQEITGQDTLSVTHGGRRYVFLNEANKRRFEADPERFGVQMGGACARMGPLSGEGNASRYFVHDGRIYIFASESCRTTFMKAPEEFVDRADAPPSGSPEDRARGLSLLERAVAAHGGSNRLDAVRTYRIEHSLTLKQREREYLGERIWTHSPPGRFRNEEKWDTSRYGHVVLPETGFLFSGDKTRPMVSDVHTFARQESFRAPLALLLARHSPGFVAVADGRGKAGSNEVEWLKVHIAGATSTLGIEATTGRIVEMHYRARGERIGDIIKYFSDFRPVDGVLFPFGVETLFNGRRVKQTEEKVTTVTVNSPLADGAFTQP